MPRQHYPHGRTLDTVPARAFTITRWYRRHGRFSAKLAHRDRLARTRKGERTDGLDIHRRSWPEFECSCELRPLEGEESESSASTVESERASS
jgi:hypothetical protein